MPISLNSALPEDCPANELDLDTEEERVSRTHLVAVRKLPVFPTPVADLSRDRNTNKSYCSGVHSAVPSAYTPNF